MFLFSYSELSFYKLTFLATSLSTPRLSDLAQSLQLPFSRALGARSCDVMSLGKNWLSPARLYLWQLEGIRIAHLFTCCIKPRMSAWKTGFSQVRFWPQTFGIRPLCTSSFRSLLILVKNMSWACLLSLPVRKWSKGHCITRAWLEIFHTLSHVRRKSTRFLRHALRWTLKQKRLTETLKHYRNIAKCDLNSTKQNKQCEYYTKNVYIISG